MSQSDKSKPFLLVGLAAAAGAVTGLASFMTTGDIRIAGISAGGGFVVTILVLAMVVLSKSPQLPKRDDNPHDV